ncbi:MAG: hypothetical protein EXX96DRAFT_269288 [Benjaminiella poitrasii]|nr:MAG: hypothetical protein EXX96DRAFT_269288 [Benjaminiella poitrasii]
MTGLVYFNPKHVCTHCSYPLYNHFPLCSVESKRQSNLLLLGLNLRFIQFHSFFLFMVLAKLTFNEKRKITLLRLILCFSFYAFISIILSPSIIFFIYFFNIAQFFPFVQPVNWIFYTPSATTLHSARHHIILVNSTFCGMENKSFHLKHRCFFVDHSSSIPFFIISSVSCLHFFPFFLCFVVLFYSVQEGTGELNKSEVVGKGKKKLYLVKGLYLLEFLKFVKITSFGQILWFPAHFLLPIILCAQAYVIM